MNLPRSVTRRHPTGKWKKNVDELHRVTQFLLVRARSYVGDDFNLLAPEFYI